MTAAPRRGPASSYLGVLLFISVFKGFVQEHNRDRPAVPGQNHRHHSLSDTLDLPNKTTVTTASDTLALHDNTPLLHPAAIPLVFSACWVPLRL